MSEQKVVNRPGSEIAERQRQAEPTLHVAKTGALMRIYRYLRVPSLPTDLSFINGNVSLPPVFQSWKVWIL